MPPQVKTIRTIGDGDIDLFEREIGQVDFVEGQQRKFDIKEQPNQIKRLMIHCVVTTACTSLSVVPGPDGAFNLIDNIQIKTSQGLVLKNFSGIQIALLDNYEFYTPLQNTVPADIGGATTTFEFDIVVPFEDHTGVLVERTILNTNYYNDLALYITWANVVNIWTGWTPAAPDTIAVSCQIISCERPPIDRTEELLARQQMLDSVVRVNADNLESLLPENTMIKTLMLVTRTPQGVRADGLFEYLTVSYDSGNYVLRYLQDTAIQSQNKDYYHIEQVATGVYVIEFDQMRDFKSLFKTFGRNFAKLSWTLPAGADENQIFDIFRRRIATPKMITV